MSTATSFPREIATESETDLRTGFSGLPTASDGLCPTCNHREGCCLVAHTEKPVLQCEEFDGYQAAPSTPPRVVRAPEATPEPFRFSGLCADCAHRATCQYARANGGVWTCEEYA